MSRKAYKALCVHVFNSGTDKQLTKYHPADVGGRFYLCDCGQDTALKNKLDKAHGVHSVNKLYWNINFRRKTRKGQNWLQTNKGPYG